MAKADDKFSTTVWIWLRDALNIAAARLGSRVLAKKLLTEWLAAGKLPWSCMSLEGLDQEGLAKLRERKKTFRGVLSVPSAAYCPGDPPFWSARLIIDWEDNWAREATRAGATAMGIKVSREHFRALLPAELREGEEVHGVGAWIAAEARRMKAANEIPPDFRITDFARELETRMSKAAVSDNSLRPIKWRSIKNRLREWGLWPVTSIK